MTLDFICYADFAAAVRSWATVILSEFASDILAQPGVRRALSYDCTVFSAFPSRKLMRLIPVCATPDIDDQRDRQLCGLRHQSTYALNYGADLVLIHFEY